MIDRKDLERAIMLRTKRHQESSLLTADDIREEDRLIEKMVKDLDVELWGRSLMAATGIFHSIASQIETQE